jgi:hypothetical protein
MCKTVTFTQTSSDNPISKEYGSRLCLGPNEFVSLAGTHRTCLTRSLSCLRLVVPTSLARFVLPITIAITSQAFAYQGAEHSNIGDQARALFLAVAPGNQWCGVSPLTNAQVWDHIAYMLVHEDDGGSWVRHFWNPDGGTNDGWFGYDSAYVYAQSLADTVLFPAYQAGDRQLAYQTLGRIGHLVSDMGVPAHVHNDPHPFEEWYEKEYIGAVVGGVKVNYVFAGVDDIRTGTLFGLMYNLAERADNYPSNDREGEEHAWADLFETVIINGEPQVVGKPGTGPLIANDCYKGAIGSLVGLFHWFFDAVHPVAGPLSPVNTAISGIWGSDFLLYGTEFGVGALIVSQGELTCSTASAAPDPWDEWAWAPVDADYMGISPFALSWRPSSLNRRAWLRARVWDSLRCESPPAIMGWVDIDSTRPGILNVSIQAQ